MSTLVIAVLLLLLAIPLMLAVWFGRLLWRQSRAARAQDAKSEGSR